MKKPQYSELGLRPTTSKVIGAIFSMMGHSNLEGKNFLDLYAGTGSVGIRALELGAKHCFFLDRNQDFIQKIKLTEWVLEYLHTAFDASDIYMLIEKSVYQHGLPC